MKTFPHELKKEMEEHKAFVAVEYMKGRISKKDLISALGKKDAKDIEFIAKITKKGFEDAKKLADNLIFEGAKLMWKKD